MITVIDTETTGLGPTDEPVEVALVAVDENTRTITQAFSSLVRPRVPCSVEARAVHHIAPEETDAARPLGEVLDSCDLWRDRGVLAAHNAEFDLRMLTQGLALRVSDPPGDSSTIVDSKSALSLGRSICTWRCAMHLWPDAPGYSNSVLRYFLNLDCERLLKRFATGLPPHRALPDALVTAALLLLMLDTHILPHLLRLTAQPVILRACRFGKHRGKSFEEIARTDRGYLEWMLRQTGGGAFDADARATAQHWLGAK